MQDLQHLGNEAVQIGVSGSLNVQIPAADVVDCLVIKHDSHIGVLQKRVSGEHAVVRFHHCSRNLGTWKHAHRQLRLFPIVDGQSLQQQGAQTWASATTHGVEHQESLQPRTVVGKLADPIQAQVHNLLANCSRQNKIICKWNYVNNGGVLSGTQGPRRLQRSNWKLTMDFWFTEFWSNFAASSIHDLESVCAQSLQEFQDADQAIRCKLYITRSFGTTPCVQCGKALRYPC